MSGSSAGAIACVVAVSRGPSTEDARQLWPPTIRYASSSRGFETRNSELPRARSPASSRGKRTGARERVRSGLPYCEDDRPLRSGTTVPRTRPTLSFATSAQSLSHSTDV